MKTREIRTIALGYSIICAVSVASASDSLQWGFAAFIALMLIAFLFEAHLGSAAEIHDRESAAPVPEQPKSSGR